jgi:predicted MFS family arabinose efflux permease
MRLFTRDFFLLWHGQLVSHVGNQAFLVATTFLILERTGSASLVAGAMIASTLPIVLLAPLGGALADRHSRRLIVVLTDLVRGLSIGALALLVLCRPDLPSAHVAAVTAVAAFNGAMQALFAPAFQSLVPDLVPPERLPWANAVNQMSSQAATLVGQALGGVLYAMWGPAALLLIDACSFSYAGVATSRLPAGRARTRAGTDIRTAFAGYLADTRDGLRYVRTRPGMPAALAIFAGVNCLFMPVFVLLPFFTRDVLGAGPAWYGFLLSGSGIGALAGSTAAGLVLRRTRRRAALVRTLLAGVAVCVLLLSATGSPHVALAAFAGIGVCSSMVNVTVLTAFQSVPPPGVRGRVMALVIALSTASVPLGMAAGGIAGDRWPAALPLVFAGCGVAIAAITAASWSVRGFADVFEPQPEPEPV